MDHISNLLLILVQDQECINN